MKFSSFAILDTENAHLPKHNYNKVGVCELSIYGIAAEVLENRYDEHVPKLPPVLHKISLMTNPRMGIIWKKKHPSGLNNYMLESESPFNENAANLVLNFLNHLRQPVCLVAHSGLDCDFPIVKHILDKFKKKIPENMYCIDSMRAFHDIDQERKLKALEIVENSAEETEFSENGDLKAAEAEKKFDARTQNETTPERPTTSVAAAATKRKRIDRNKNDESDNLEKKPSKAKRILNFENDMNLSYQKVPGKKFWTPPRGEYTLRDCYIRIFHFPPEELHRAEADVLALTQLMLHYGKDFIDYAERHAITFKSVARVGETNI